LCGVSVAKYVYPFARQLKHHFALGRCHLGAPQTLW
jgi:hypothetical protein